jgi:catechol 2,3-dioxygenase-like lactoylglutathione lyase family enzyme
MTQPAILRHPRVRAQRIARVSRVVADLGRAEAFYQQVLGFECRSRGALDPALRAALGDGAALGDAATTEPPAAAAHESVMALGSEEIALVEFDVRGRPYPAHSKSNDAWFQHCAIVVRDMNAAYAQLRSQGGWQPISSDGPQQLPAANGGVKAFKFRDPDGHPLELLWFPPGSGRAIWQDAERHAASLDAEQRVGRARDDAGQRAGRARHDAAALFLGIDHTALAIASTRASLEFYGSLGFRLSARSFNHGVAQAHLDGLTPSEARVRIAALRPASSEGPGIELLAYRPPASGRPGPGLPARGGGRASAATPQDGAGPAAAAAHAWSAALADQATDWITVLAATPGSGAQQPASHLASAPLPSASESPRR